MEDPIRSIIVRIRTSDYTNHRKILAVSSGDGVDDAEAADGERDDARADTFSTRVAVGCVASVELIAAADHVELRLGDQKIEEGQIEVTGNREDVSYADLDEPPSQVAAESAARGGRRCRRWSRAGRSR